MNVQHHHDQPHRNISHGHDRNDHLGHGGNALYATENDQRREQGQHHTRDNLDAHGVGALGVEGISNRTRNRVGLHRIKHKAVGNSDQHGKQHRQPAPSQRLGDVVGRSTPVRILIPYLVHLRQGGFHKGGSTANDR